MNEKHNTWIKIKLEDLLKILFKKERKLRLIVGPRRPAKRRIVMTEVTCPNTEDQLFIIAPAEVQDGPAVTFDGTPEWLVPGNESSWEVNPDGLSAWLLAIPGNVDVTGSVSIDADRSDGVRKITEMILCHFVDPEAQVLNVKSATRRPAKRLQPAA